MKTKNNCILALMLTLPVIVFFAGYFFYHSDGLYPTGFIQYDNVSYLAYARQYIDHSFSHVQYTNPFNDGGNYHPIYFQTQTILFAILLKSGINPAFILPFFTIICAFICFLFLIKIYGTITLNKSNRVLNLWLFSWGGGILIIASIITYYLAGTENSATDKLFAFDPEKGWWGLNLGRSLFFSCEAYYHAIFLACIYFLLKKKWLPALFSSLLLSMSHPFSGIELNLILFGWFMVELFFGRKNVPAWWGAGIFAIIALHIYYYLFYLEQFPDHRSVSKQYSLLWPLQLDNILLAYCFVGAFAIATIYKSTVKRFLQVQANRLFLCWFFIAFGLANHELFIEAKQPIHFTRGYIWTSLFLLGLPSLQNFIIRLKTRNFQVGLFAFIVLFLFDNFTWISRNIKSKPNEENTAYVTQEQKTVLDVLDKNCSNSSIIISNDACISYLSTVYTKAYPLYSHPFTTPFAKEKKKVLDKFYERGELDTSLKSRELVFVIKRTDTTASTAVRSLKAKNIFESSGYTVFNYSPGSE